jgi:hypothetical protein
LDADLTIGTKMADGELDRMIQQSRFTSTMPAAENEISGELARASIFEMAGGEPRNNTPAATRTLHKHRTSTTGGTDSNLDSSVSSDNTPPTPSSTPSAAGRTGWRATEFIPVDVDREMVRRWTAAALERSDFFERSEYGFRAPANSIFLTSITRSKRGHPSNAENKPVAGDIPESPSDNLFEQLGKKVNPATKLFAKMDFEHGTFDGAAFLIALSLACAANKQTRHGC